jgi:hypothetical protein
MLLKVNIYLNLKKANSRTFMNTTWIKLTFNTKMYFIKQHLFLYQDSNYTIKEYWTMWLHIKGNFIHLWHLIFHRNGVIQLKQFITYSAGIWHILHMQIRGKWMTHSGILDWYGVITPIGITAQYQHGLIHHISKSRKCLRQCKKSIWHSYKYTIYLISRSALCNVVIYHEIGWNEN